MATFEYQAIDSSGKSVKGIIEGDGEKSARQALRSKGLIVTHIKNPNKARSSTTGKFDLKALLSKDLFRSKIQTTDLMLFTRQLSTLVASGMAVEGALKLIAEQTDSRNIKIASSQIRQKINEGLSIALAMNQSSLRFPQDYISTISAGEETGHMTEVLLRLADDVEHQAQSKQALSSALIYPIIMILVSISVVVLLIVYVVPQVANVFGSLNQDLPTMTIFLIGMSDFLVNYGIYLLYAILISILIFLWRYNRSYDFKYKIHKKLFSIPVFGDLILSNELARWARSLGLLLNSGVPTLEALRIGSKVVVNVFLQDCLNKINEQVREGQSFHLSMRKFPIIPSFIVHMTSSGENSGNLDEMILKVAAYYEQYIKLKTSTTLKLIEPMLIVIMGGVILMIVLAVLLPIFELNQLV